MAQDPEHEAVGGSVNSVNSEASGEISGESRNNSREAIKFISEHLESRFDESNARKLFSFYTIDENGERLEAPDVRKLLLDILKAKKCPLVVPDEALDNVLYELCLNGKGAISWIEFKSFFVFLQELPLLKLFEIVTNLYSKDELETARIITIKNSNHSKDNNIDNNNSNENDNEGNDNNVDNDNNNNNNNGFYDRQGWKRIISEMIKDSGAIFIYYLDSNSLLCLVLGKFSESLSSTESVTAEIIMDDTTYIAEMRGFDINNDVFPPIARSGGIKSKVARKIADTYLIAKSWDNNHLKLGKAMGTFAKTADTKFREFDEKYRVKEKVNNATKSAVTSIKTFDEQHQISKKITDTAKEMDDKYKITEKINTFGQSIRSNTTYQNITNRLSLWSNQTFKSIEDISKETKQLVNEKESNSNNDNINNNNNIDDNNDNNIYNDNDSKEINENDLNDNFNDMNINNNGNVYNNGSINRDVNGNAEEGDGLMETNEMNQTNVVNGRV